MNKYICIHGHFYQPPRENPWLEAIELQDSAHPYRDWNQRITAECYAPNVASRILDEKGEIKDIINNYAKMNFNFGPTLLSWLEREEPDIYLAILKADKSSQHFFNGHGSAIAQAYNHMILPLANQRDKQTQVFWGIKDFEFRFKRRPAGMWLPETAVDIATLEVLASNGIQYTILAPYQAEAVRKIGSKTWTDLKGEPVSSIQPYLCRLPSGKRIAVFFYDGTISHGIAFEGLLNNGEALANRLIEAFPQDHDSALIHVATDGETYGHHHRFGNMALSYGIHHIESNRLARIVVLSHYLQQHPPTHEVKIKEGSSWSCAHGVERWRSDCGCCIGGHSWNQKWRGPLRNAMDWLRDQLAEVYESGMKEFFHDAWAVRDEYIQIILDRSQENTEEFFRKQCPRELTREEKTRVLRFLEMQRHAMFMYTSCGWFFDEVSGIETIQIMRYAARALQLANELCGRDFEPEFLTRLQEAKSNLPEYKNARNVYNRFVKPEVIDLLSVGAHFGISSLFQDYPQPARVYSYHININDRQLHEIGKQKLLIGTVDIRSEITREEASVDFAVFHFGDYNIQGGVRFHQDERQYTRMHDDLVETFTQNNVADMIHQMSRCFGDETYTLWDLFKNEQGKVLEDIFQNTLTVIESSFRGIYDHYYPLMQIRPDVRIPLPKALAVSVEFILNRDLAVEMEKKKMDFKKIERLLREMKRWNFTRDKDAIKLAATAKLDELMQNLTRTPRDSVLLNTICELMNVCRILPLDLDIWRAQNIYFSMTQRLYPRMKELAQAQDDEAMLWVMHFERLSGFLRIQSP